MKHEILEEADNSGSSRLFVGVGSWLEMAPPERCTPFPCSTGRRFSGAKHCTLLSLQETSKF